MRHALRAGWAAAFVATSLQAQISGRVDALVGPSPAYSRESARPLLGVSPALLFQSPRVRLEAESEFREGRGPLGAATGSLALSHFTPLHGPLLGELTGSTRFRSGFSGGNGLVWDAGVRFHLRSASEGVWVLLSGGRDLQGSTARWEATAWRRLGAVSLQLTGSQTSIVSVAPSAAAATDTLARAPDSTTSSSVRVATDLGAWLRWGVRRFELAVGAGRRYGSREVAPSPSTAPGDGTQDRTVRDGGRVLVNDWWLAEAVWKLTPRLGLVGSMGRSPPDLQFGTPAGKFLRLAVRASVGRAAAATRDPGATAAGVRVSRLRSGQVEVEVAVSGEATVSRVEIMGDFTDWLPVDLDPTGERRWRARLAIVPGIHYLNVRYDGGPWQPPPGTAVVADDFGRVTGMIVVE